MNKALKALGVLTTFVMLIVLIGGALVTKTGSRPRMRQTVAAVSRPFFP